MKNTIAMFAVASMCLIAASGCTSNPTLTLSSRPIDAAHGNAQGASPGSPELMLQQAIEEQSLKNLGVQPGTTKAAIVLKWQRQLRNDPELKNLLVAGLPSAQTPAGTLLLMDGMSRISPEQRAEFWTLYARVAAAHLPDNCYGERNPAAISRRVMTFGNFTDEDADEYLRLFTAMLHASVRHEPEHVPTAAEHQVATIALGKIIETNIKDKADADRLAHVMLNRATASLEDTCWLAKISIAAINQLSPTDKEAVLASSVHDAAVAAARQLPAPAAPASAPKAAPASVKQL